MWYNLVSSLESTVHMVMFGLVVMGAQHPLAATGIVLFFVLIIAMLVAESIAEHKAAARSDPVVPLRIKR